MSRAQWEPCRSGTCHCQQSPDAQVHKGVPKSGPSILSLSSLPWKARRVLGPCHSDPRCPGLERPPEAITGAEAGGGERVAFHVALVEAVVLREAGMRALQDSLPEPPATLGRATRPYLPLQRLGHLGAIGSRVGLRVARAHQVPRKEPL